MERILGHTGTGGERGRIMNPKSFANSLSATDYKDPQKTIKHLTKCEIVAMPLREEKRREEKRREEKRREEKRREPLNAMPDGTCRTIKHQYYKNSVANFESQGSFGATGTLRKFSIDKG